MKKKDLINKLFIIFSLCLSLLYLNGKEISAASFGMSPTSKSVNVGDEVSLSLSASGCYVKFSVTVSGAGVLVSAPTDVDDKTVTIKVKATETGTITVKVNGIASDYIANPIDYSVSALSKITVKQKTTEGGSSGGSSGNSGNSGNTGGNTNGNTGNNGGIATPDNRSKENSLESLSVSSGTLSPNFSADETSYKVDLTSDITKFTINAKAKDSKAKVSGIGEKELKLGENNFIISVVAENGAKKTYTMSAYVTEKASVFTKYLDKDYGVLTDFSKADLPKGFSPTTVKVGDKDVSALKSETTGLTLLYLQDAEGKTGFYIYENDTVVGKFQTITINQKVYVILNDKNAVKEVNGIKESTIKIGDLEVQGWSFDDKKLSNYSLVYLMNDAGEKVLYSYEGTEGTLQKYVSTTSSSNNTLTYVFVGTTILFVITTGVAVAMYFNFKKKSISAIKDYYDNKNQGE